MGYEVRMLAIFVREVSCAMVCCSCAVIRCCAAFVSVKDAIFSSLPR
jgi:hypothetical protein